MKLTKIAGVVVAVIGVVAVGGSWYTGTQVEQKYRELVEQSNAQLKQFSQQYGFNIALKDVDIERHFFSSDAKYRIEIDTGEGEKSSITGNDKLYHGPFPLNRLAKFNLMPVLMSVESNTLAPEALKTAMGEKLGTGVSNVSYSGNIEGEYTISSTKFESEKSWFTSSPLKMVYSYAPNSKANNKADFNIENIELKGDDFNFLIKGVEYAFQQADDKGYANLGMGNGKGSISSIEVLDQKEERSEFKNIRYNFKTELQNDRVFSESKAEIDTVNITGIDLGKLKFDVNIDMDAKTADEVVAMTSNPALMNEDRFAEIGIQLLAKSMKFHINQFSVEKEKGKADFALLLNIARFEPNQLSDFDSLLKLLSQSKMAFNLNRDYLEQINRQVLIYKNKLGEEEAKAQAKQEVEMIFANANSSGFTVTEGDVIKSEMLADNGKLTLNGKPLTEEQIQMLVFAIMMMGSGMGN